MNAKQLVMIEPQEGETLSGLTDDKVGAICAMIGKSRDSIASQYLPGYDAKIAAMSADRERKAALMAEYNRLAEAGYTDDQIESLMGD